VLEVERMELSRMGKGIDKYYDNPEKKWIKNLTS
jgi:hypothetical protein